MCNSSTDSSIQTPEKDFAERTFMYLIVFRYGHSNASMSLLAVTTGTVIAVIQAYLSIVLALYVATYIWNLTQNGKDQSHRHNFDSGIKKHGNSCPLI